MAQWMQCDWIQQTPTWADSVCNIHPDTHDGFDEKKQRKVKDRVKADESAFKSRREQLREAIERAWDGPQPEPVAAQVQAIAAPYVERLESGALRIDYEGAKRVQGEILALQSALRAEYEARAAIERDDEDVMILAAAWR